MSTAEIGDAVKTLPVPNRFVHVYHILFAGMLSHHVEFNEVLWMVTTNEFHNISETVNL